MKKVFKPFILLAFLSISFFSNANNDAAIVKEETKIDKYINEVSGVVETITIKDQEVSCTVSENGYTATVIRFDGNTAKACRQARRLVRKAQQ